MTRASRGSAVLVYSGAVALTAVVTLVSIPIIIGAVGAHAWASLSVGQAVGTAGAIVVGFGWGITGPTHVAAAGAEERRSYFVNSLSARVLLYVPVAGTAGVLTALVVQHASAASVLNAVAYSTTGLLSGWFFTGTARPWRYFAFDALPRIAGTAVGTVLVGVGLPLWVYPLAQLFGALSGTLATSSTVLGRQAIGRPRLTTVLGSLRGQSHGMALSSVSAVVTALPPMLVSLIAPASLPVYSLGDKLMRFATTAFSPILQFMQGWVPAVRGAQRVQRVKLTVAFGGGMAVVGGVAFALLAPVLSTILSRSAVPLTAHLSVLFAILLAVLVGAQVVGLVGLLALDAARQFAICTLIGAAVGMPAVALGAFTMGAGGAVGGFIVGESVALVLEAILLVGLLRKSERF